METQNIENPFSENWWKEFNKNSNHMSVPLVVRNVIKRDAQRIRESIYEMLGNLKNENNDLAWRIWVDGQQDKNKNKKKQIINDPILSNDDLENWRKRNFGNQKFGIILNNGQKYSENSRSIISKYFEPLLKNKPPFGGINFSIFIGNYGWTPLGIHEDHTGSFVMHFHLGPGEKTMYMWERENFKENLKGSENDMNPEKYLPFADYKCHFKEGDVFFMPWNYYHIGKAEELSISLTVWFNYTTVDGILNGIWDNGFKRFKENGFGNRLLPNIEDNKDTVPIDLIVSKLNENDCTQRLKDFISEEIDDYTGALISNNWYDTSNIKEINKTFDINDNTLITLKSTAIYYKCFPELIKIYHNGNKLSLNYHPDLEVLIEKLNTYKIFKYSNIVEGLFIEWPSGISLRILEIFGENNIIKIVKN